MWPKWDSRLRTAAENIIKVMYERRPWKWTMDCWEVTGTKVNTKPKVVTPSKKAKEMATPPPLTNQATPQDKQPTPLAKETGGRNKQATPHANETVVSNQPPPHQTKQQPPPPQKKALLLQRWLPEDTATEANSLIVTTEKALNSIFTAWKIRASREWNTSSELCSGVAIDDNIFIDDKAYNPFIKCDCTFNNSTICRITALKVYALDVVGPIPPQLWTLIYLTNLNLAQNYLTGSISPAIGNLTRMEWLGIGLNNFSGPIPAEIGTCTKLLKIYLSNSGLRGEVPSTFANLVELEDVSMNDLDVTGQIPELIGNWTKLTILKIQGTGWRGPIPSSFSNLTSLTEFLLGDISNGGSSLEIIKDMKSLSILVLRNNNLTGTIPSNFGEYSNLLELDVSYNDLSGSLPSWVSLPNLDLNLVANNFTLNGLDKRVLARLKCLQKNFPCNRGKGIYSEFLINCGGPQKRSFSGAVFERDDVDHGSTSFYVSDVERWAVSSVGIYNGGNYGPLISAVSAKPDFTPTVDNRPPSKQNNRTGTVTGVIVGLGLLGLFAGAVIFIIRKRSKGYTDDEELLNMDVKPYTFTYSELKSATQDFDPANKLGEGGFGSIYKGTLNDGREIAVKVLSVGSRQGKGQFVAEIIAISAVMHRNLVKLYGCCFEKHHRLLVYEYLPNGSLDYALFGGDKTLHLDWSTRFEICMGVARGLAYLHEEASVRIVHRDVKAGNILLDSNLLPKVSDFGLANLYDDKKTHISTRVAGTIGYLAPEYAMRGHLTEKTDVYAFGIVALELVSGRKNSDVNLGNEKKYLLEWTWNLHENSREVELVDHKLSEFNTEEVKRIIGIALLCTYSSHSLRPSMSRVVAMLTGDVEVSDVTSKLGYLTDMRFDETSNSSFSAFQTIDTGASTSYSTGFVAPKDSDHKPMLGVKINAGR
ncbi:hypothetical protein Bca52824_059408 [Brassica carinata]|uniref:non-specific serine/threonine protein kinase n=1 Tax=Brassica carinata TaxID=52824 RepID=A0A8X7QWH3_BRACI|nr:hypothetical protein Bca52824_059408 [Brassica carinata]